jgi:hypothetical protein
MHGIFNGFLINIGCSLPLWDHAVIPESFDGENTIKGARPTNTFLNFLFYRLISQRF